MEQDKKAARPSQTNPEQGNEVDPRQKEPYGPGGDRGGIDDPGSPAKKNPGQTNPAHNTPSRMRQDQAGQQDLGQPGQDQTQSYPGTKGPKTHDLQQDSAIDAKEAAQVKGGVNTKKQSAGRAGNAKDDALGMPKE